MSLAVQEVLVRPADDAAPLAHNTHLSRGEPVIAVFVSGVVVDTHLHRQPLMVQFRGLDRLDRCALAAPVESFSQQLPVRQERGLLHLQRVGRHDMPRLALRCAATPLQLLKKVGMQGSELRAPTEGPSGQRRGQAHDEPVRVERQVLPPPLNLIGRGLLEIVWLDLLARARLEGREPVEPQQVRVEWQELKSDL